MVFEVIIRIIAFYFKHFVRFNLNFNVTLKIYIYLLNNKKKKRYGEYGD